ncbi:MAG: hydratase [Desulfovibrio sp.]|jgi:aconitate hydratase|nr:hydratase [Desulfovibrio sp.]
MLSISSAGVYWRQGRCREDVTEPDEAAKALGRKKTMTYGILAAHNTSAVPGKFKIKFDGLMTHDITYVSIIQTAIASGMREFSIPVTLTNCHNTLRAVGGTINSDDHRFGLSAAMRYGGDYVPAHTAVIHQYAREMTAGCGTMLMGSDSHTRYGALGCLAVGEGGGELVKQLVGRTWDIAPPEVVAVHLTGKTRPGVGPQDVALALIAAVYKDGVVKNRVMEFLGPGIAGLSMDYRIGIDVMTTETTCLSSIWQTDAAVRDYLAAHGRPDAYRELLPQDDAWYDRVVQMDLSAVEPMIALPFHPSNAYPIARFHEHAPDILAEVEKKARALLPEQYASSVNLLGKLEKGRLRTDQGVVAGCCGGSFENLRAMAAMLKNKSVGALGYDLSVYPASQPVMQELLRVGAAADLLSAGVTLRTAFCGPCFGAGDTPGQNCLSIRHVTRNFANREGSKPPEGQIAYVAMMDARSIAATAANGGFLTAAASEEGGESYGDYSFNPALYESCVYHGRGNPKADVPLTYGPNIAAWPPMPAMPKDLLLSVASALYDPVTTTDDFIASGEPSSFRSNPQRMAEYTLQRKDPGYVQRAKDIRSLEEKRRRALAEGRSMPEEVREIFRRAGLGGREPDAGLGSLVFAVCPGDGSAREQAASCQKVLGGWANIAGVYATKRYRSNCINWGLLPFILENAASAALQCGDIIYVPGIRAKLQAGETDFDAERVRGGVRTPLRLALPGIADEERSILLAGSLINYYNVS